ncbi:MAG: hypothetical protein ACYC6T_07680 [Thermoleophilia bacterium]
MLLRSDARGGRFSPNRYFGNDGFSVLEILVIVAIVAAVAAIGVPTLHHTSVNAVLDGNVRNLAALVEEEMLQGLDSTYHQAGEGSPDTFLSNRLEYVLGQAQGAARYVNPQAEGAADLVLNSASVPPSGPPGPPAVFITGNPSWTYESFDAQPLQTGRQLLAGSMVVQFNSLLRSVDVFFVDQEGEKSTDVARFLTG